MGSYLAAGLLGGAGLALLGAHHKANVLNKYDASLNSQLQQQGAAPLNFEHRNFVFKSDADTAASHQKLYDDAVKAHQLQTQLNDYNNQGAQYGLQHFSNPTSAKDLVSPYTTKDADFKIQGQYGQRAAQGAIDLQNIFQNQNRNNSQPMSAFAPPQGAPIDPNEPQLDEAPALQTGLSQQAPLQFSPDAYITPDLVKAAQANAVSQQNADASTRNAETNAGGLSLRQQQFQTIQQPESKAKLQRIQIENRKTQQDIANIQQIMKYRPREAEARIKKLAQRTGTQPNAISLMLQSGKSPKQIGDALYSKLQFESAGMDFGDGSGSGASPTPAPGGLPSFNAWKNGAK